MQDLFIRLNAAKDVKIDLVSLSLEAPKHVPFQGRDVVRIAERLDSRLSGRLLRSI